MSFSQELITLGKYLAGEFDNKQQANSQPIWYVHLRLWMRPVNLFTIDSIAIFAEQASVVNIDRPYRPRILRLQQDPSDPNCLQVKYYMFEDISQFCGAGRKPELLQKITPEQIRFLPDCSLKVKVEKLHSQHYQFKTAPASENPCTFNYKGDIYQVFLGFDVTLEELKTYDRGIDRETGKATWGALMGPYCFQKIKDFAGDLPI